MVLLLCGIQHFPQLVTMQQQKLPYSQSQSLWLMET